MTGCQNPPAVISVRILHIDAHPGKFSNEHSGSELDFRPVVVNYIVEAETPFEQATVKKHLL